METHRISIVYDVNKIPFGIATPSVYRGVVSKTTPIPVRLDEALIQRLDRAAARLGNTRAGVMRLCLTAFLDHFERAGGVASLPLNWDEIVEYWDGRTRRSHGAEPKPQHAPVGSVAPYSLNEPAVSPVVAQEAKGSIHGAKTPFRREYSKSEVRNPKQIRNSKS